MSYPETYYKNTLAETSTRPILAGHEECETLIIGAGLAGLTTGLQLARAGHSVIILEAQSVGFGASGRNGGCVSAGYATGLEDIARVTGEEQADELYRLSHEGVAFIRDTINQLALEEEAKPVNGILSVRRYDDGVRVKQYIERMQARYGHQLDYVEPDEVRALLKSPRYFQAAYDRNAFHIHPLNYLRGLAREIERLGGRIFEASPAISQDLSATIKTVVTPQGRVSAKNIVFTTGGYTGSLNKKLQRAFLPIATYVMVSEEAPDLIATAITTSSAVIDNRRAGDYYRLVENGRRLLWGGRISTREASVDGLVRELRREMTATYPQLTSLKTEIAWSGLMSYARHLMPQIGQMAPGIWYCTAFGGHGLNTTAIGGKVIAEGILGGSERYKLFAPFGLVWTGGYAGLAAAQLVYWKLRLQDWWHERG